MRESELENISNAFVLDGGDFASSKKEISVSRQVSPDVAGLQSNHAQILAMLAGADRNWTMGAPGW